MPRSDLAAVAVQAASGSYRHYVGRHHALLVPLTHVRPPGPLGVAVIELRVLLAHRPQFSANPIALCIWPMLVLLFAAAAIVLWVLPSLTSRSNAAFIALRSLRVNPHH